MKSIKDSASGKLNLMQMMCLDAALPAHIKPDGFLGRHLLRELLRREEAKIYCLVRASDDAIAEERVAASLAEIDIDYSEHCHRLRVLCGDISLPNLGLDKRTYREVGSSVGKIYHCAAEVNWTRSYRLLRKSNVLGTLELIRLACTGPVKRIYFSSTIAVCYANGGPEEIFEETDMLPYVDRMPLGYAQSKCVSESLLRSAANRGVPVSIVRPALISGDSHSGVGNPDDILTSLVTGCVESKCAADSDWQLDCVPVDYVARVLCRLNELERPHWEVLNLFNERGRHWREIVLWMNLHGYRVYLVPYTDWLRYAFGRETALPRLFAFRRFFGALNNRFAGPAPYETYLEKAQCRVSNRQTLQKLREIDLDIPPLDAELLGRYFDHFVDAGLLPPSQYRRRNGDYRDNARMTLEQAIEPRLREEKLRVVSITERPFSSRNGIFNEISAARVGGYIGIRRYDVLVRSKFESKPKVLRVLMKSKPSDELMEDLLVEVATLCDPDLGAHCEAVKRDLGLSGCHERELALFELDEARLRRYMPAGFGTHRDQVHGVWTVAMEYLADAEKTDITTLNWTPQKVRTIVRSLADMHAAWYGQEHKLSEMSWLVPPPDPARMAEMVPFWDLLRRFSEPFFRSWAGSTLAPQQKTFIEELDEWWPILRAKPQTLIHNDCNPRNLVLRGTNSGVTPSFFDWELATIHVPQHDVAELLCFVLPAECGSSMLAAFLELHRSALESATGIEIDSDDYMQAFALSLRYLLINRLALYTLMHRFRRQAFLPQVINNWQRMYHLCGDSALARASNTLN